MKAEMQEDYDKAAKILDTILDEDEANNQAKKRKIAMIKDVFSCAEVSVQTIFCATLSSVS